MTGTLHSTIYTVGPRTYSLDFLKTFLGCSLATLSPMHALFGEHEASGAAQCRHERPFGII